jgi:putative oxidoreductase
MFRVRREDFRIKAANFDLRQSGNVLRIICGVFFFPDIAGKFAGFAISPAIAGFFDGVSSAPAETSVYFAAAAEAAAASCLVLGLCTRYAAFGAFALMAAAVYSLQVVGGYGWTWNPGGYEYPAFSAIIALCVAADAWRGALAAPRLQTAERAIPRRSDAAKSRLL